MLSNQKCTNQTGPQHRQLSPPADFSSNKAFFSAEQPAEPNVQYSVFERSSKEPGCSRDVTPRRNSNSKENVGLQHDHENSQTSQELNARPGSKHRLGDRQQYEGKEWCTGIDLPNREGLSDADINTLLKDLGSADDCPEQFLFDFGCDSRQTMDFKIDGKDQNEAMPFTLFAQHVTKPQHEQPRAVSPRVELVASARTPRITAEPALPEHMDIRVERDDSVKNAGMIVHRHRSSQDGSVDEIIATSIASSPKTAISCHNRDPMPIAPFKVESEPTKRQETGRPVRHSVDFALLRSGDFLDMSDLKADMPIGRGGYDPAIYSPLANSLSSNFVSVQSSPEVTGLTLFEDAGVDRLVIDAQQSFIRATQGDVGSPEPNSPDQLYQHESHQSAAELDVEECVRDTGVTTEEIASFIQGPLPEDQKWSCLFEEVRGKPCGKRFARKENAKSHVQTHLGDRQFVCKVCSTPFVRQHDLKRHFKIHTIEKAHRCPCGKDFHRHDALTRHRQRGMCVGAFGGTPKKVVKRGRPKKARPSTEERSEKAAKTRQYVMERTKPGSTYASSISGGSECSAPSPQDFDNLSVTASSPSISHRAFDDFRFPVQHAQPLTPPASPDRISGILCLPPSAYHTEPVEVARQSLSPRLTTIPEDPARSDLSSRSQEQYQVHSSPPELDLSSSSPATSQIFDFSAYSEITGSQDPYQKSYDAARPQIFNHDFQLFNSSTREPEDPIKFEDFLDFGNIESTSTDKYILQNHPSMMDLR